MKTIQASALFCWLSMVMCVWAGPATPPANLALHRPCRFDAAPSYRYCTDPDDPAQPTDGKYVQGIFVDEVEVWPGPEKWLREQASGPVVTNTERLTAKIRIRNGLKRRLERDVASLRGLAKTADLPDAPAQAVARELEAIARAIPGAVEAFDPPPNWTTVFPMHPLHRRIFRAQAALWRGDGFPEVVVWPARRWGMLPPVLLPRVHPAKIEVHAMRGEFRSAAVNLANATDADRTVRLSMEGMPGGPTPPWIEAHAVPFTDTQSGVPVAAALPVLPRKDNGWPVRLVSGLPTQVWFTVHPTKLKAGDYRGCLRIECGKGLRRTVPFRLKVYPIDFPEQPALHLGGWDYTDRERCYQVTPMNRTAFIRHLREHFVDSPWARSEVMPPGKYDASGHMTEPPDAAQFRAWLDRWPGARCYMVFSAVGPRFAGFDLDTPPFRRALGEWIHWWVARLRQWSIRPGQLGLLLVDEPHTPEQARIIIAYARVIQAAEPEVVVWEDPTWPDPTQAPAEFFTVCDVLCPNRPMWIGHGKAFADFYETQRAAGRRLWFYSCSGPGRLLDPYGYHRLQQWFCWKYGAEGSGFWAFGDSNGASSWNEYLAPRGAYTPLFLDGQTVTSGKHMEAIREGMEDYEYLRLLRDRVENLEQAGVNNLALSRARKLLDTAADRVLAPMNSPASMQWQTPKDRSTADQVRLEILQALLSLRNMQGTATK